MSSSHGPPGHCPEPTGESPSKRQPRTTHSTTQPGQTRRRTTAAKNDLNERLGSAQTQKEERTGEGNREACLHCTLHTLHFKPRISGRQRERGPKNIPISSTSAGGGCHLCIWGRLVILLGCFPVVVGSVGVKGLLGCSVRLSHG